MDHLHHGHDMMMRRPPPSTTVDGPPGGTTVRPEAAVQAVARRNGLASAPTPPRVYRVEPREFRDLVQRLTGAPVVAPARQRVAVAPTQPVAVRASGVDTAGQMNAPWLPFPLMALAEGMHPGLDGHQLT